MRIYNTNEYAIDKFKSLGISNPEIELKYSVIPRIEKCRIQEDFNDKKEAVFISTSQILKIIYSNLNFSDILSKEHEFAKTKWYMRSKAHFWTRFSINRLLKYSIKVFNLKAKTHTRLLKDVFFDFDDFQYLLKEENMPIILTIKEANNGTYKSHTLLVVGYVIYRDKISGEECRFLIVNDNYSIRLTYLDYDSISTWSQINYLNKY